MTSIVFPNIESIVERVSQIKIDKNSATQSFLNIENKKRSSLFPWRGQFSPQLVEYLLAENTSNDCCILDPFCGGGTTLYEAARKNFTCYGSDVNPAAYIVSSIMNFCEIKSTDRLSICREIRNLASKNISYFEDNSLFNSDAQYIVDFQNELLDFYKECQSSFENSIILTLCVMLAMGDQDTANPGKFFKSINSVLDTIQMLPYRKKKYTTLLSDARNLELIKDSNIDLILTSPPYINVFNYHQNYRKALEFLGWKPLQAAVSEIGANRKHRRNRFLTVIQYCMDMCSAFLEMRRVLHEEGKVIIVVGRTSCVRGVSFENSLLLVIIALGIAGFAVEKWQERFFTNRFGERIYEDIFTLQPESNPVSNYLEIARSVGVWGLQSSIKQATGEIKTDIHSAIASASQVQVSPNLSVEIPSEWRFSTERVKNTLLTPKVE